MSLRIQRVLTLILLLGFNLCATAQDEKGNRYALVIGNSNYIDQAPLANPVPDCKLIAETLTKLNFHVDERYNLQTRREFLDAFQTLDEQARDASVVLVYYAGHGIAVGGSNYLLPTDAVLRNEFDVEDYAVDTKSVLRYFEKQENRANILVLDACRDEPFKKTWNLSRGGGSDGLVKERGPIGSIVSYSTSYGNTAIDGTGNNSPFAKSLAKNLLFPNISIERVFTKTREDVLQETNRGQMPVEENQLLGSEIILNEQRSLIDLTQENYLFAIDTASAPIRSQIYTTIIESNKRDTTFLREIATNWFFHEFGLESAFGSLTDWMTSDLYNTSAGHAGDVNNLYSQEDFMPIIEVFDIVQEPWFPEEIHKKILLHQIAFGQVLAALDWTAEVLAESSLEELAETIVVNQSPNIWYDVYQYQTEILLSPDSLSFDDFFLTAIWSTAKSAAMYSIDEKAFDTRRQAAIDLGQIENSEEQGFFDYQTIAKRDFRQHEILEASLVYSALFEGVYRMSWENPESSTLLRYANFYNFGQGAVQGLQIALALDFISSSGAWCDETTFSQLHEKYINCWHQFLYLHELHLKNPQSALFCSDAFFYLNQSRQYAALYGLPTNELDSLATAYVNQFELFSNKVDNLNWWDFSSYSMRVMNYPYSSKINEGDESVWKMYSTVVYPTSKEDTKQIMEYHKMLADHEGDLFSEILALGVGRQPEELQLAMAPLSYSVESDYEGLMDKLKLGDWVKFITIDAIENPTDNPLLNKVNNNEKVRRVNLFLEDVVEPWYNDLKLGTYSTIYDLSTNTDLPLYWSVIDRVFDIVNNQVEIDFFVNLYFRILLDIQAKSDALVDPIYFEKIIQWYAEDFNNLSPASKLYAREQLKYYYKLLTSTENTLLWETYSLDEDDIDRLKTSISSQKSQIADIIW